MGTKLTDIYMRFLVIRLLFINVCKISFFHAAYVFIYIYIKCNLCRQSLIYLSTYKKKFPAAYSTGTGIDY